MADSEGTAWGGSGAVLLRLVRAAPERLAAAMAVPDRKLERFLVLNRLRAGQPLPPGSKVKLVVYRR
mgnify:CR=1 FL=1